MSRYSRQESIVKLERIQNSNPLIIGVGAVGREVARTIAANGIKRATIVDYDEVEEPNCVTQGYHEADIGRPKVEACAEEMIRINSDIEIQMVADRWRPSKDEFDTIFMCVDSLPLRGKIFNYYNSLDPSPLMFDSRIGGEQIRLLSVFDDESREWFPQTISADEKAYGIGCHVPMIKHSANISASMLVSQFMNSLSEGPLFKDRLFVVRTGELFDNESP